MTGSELWEDPSESNEGKKVGCCKDPPLQPPSVLQSACTASLAPCAGVSACPPRKH